MAHNKFFKSLPTDELSPMEHALRKALLKALRGMGGKNFPFIEWVDRRIGGEVETVQGEDGKTELRLRGEGGGESTTPPPPPRGGNDAFFNTLPQDNFGAPEEALRDAVFEFLATWSSPQLASLVQMQQYPEVVRRAQAFLPRNIPLKDWIEHRIGGEIEFRPGPRGGPEVVHLTESARTAVLAKFHQMSSQMPPPMPPMGHGMPPMPPMSGMGHGVLPPPPPPMGGPGGQGPDRDQFFATLPGDELLPAELGLREAIVEWIHRAARDGSRRGAPLHLSEAGGEMKIKWARQELIPPRVKLADWIERRIGGEVELRAIANGQHEIFLRGQAPPAPPAARGGGAAGGAAGSRTATATAEEKEEFFSTLPDDDFSQEEDNLRAALLDFIERWDLVEQGPPTVSDLQPEEEVQAAKKELLPKACKVGLKDWIDRRIGGEIETRAQTGGNWIFGLRGTLGAKKRRTE